MAIKGIYRGLLFGSITRSKDPYNYVDKIPVYGELEIHTVDISPFFGEKKGTRASKRYYINGRQVEPTTIKRVKRIPEDYVDPFESA